MNHIAWKVIFSESCYPRIRIITKNGFTTFLEKKFCISPCNPPPPPNLIFFKNNKEACRYSNFGYFSVLSVILSWIKTQSKPKDKKLY